MISLEDIARSVHGDKPTESEITNGLLAMARDMCNFILWQHGFIEPVDKIGDYRPQPSKDFVRTATLERIVDPADTIVSAGSTIGSRILLALASKWSQADLARKLKISSGRVSRYVTGKRRIPLEFILAVIDMTGADGHWLLTGKWPIRDELANRGSIKPTTGSVKAAAGAGPKGLAPVVGTNNGQADTVEPAVVKYQVGLRLARAGYYKMEDAARAIGIAPPYLSNILACRERPAKHQKAIARLCGCTATQLFGQFTSPELRAIEKTCA